MAVSLSLALHAKELSHRTRWLRTPSSPTPQIHETHSSEGVRSFSHRVDLSHFQLLMDSEKVVAIPPLTPTPL